jgi:hypothetical protein
MSNISNNSEELQAYLLAEFRCAALCSKLATAAMWTQAKSVCLGPSRRGSSHAFEFARGHWLREGHANKEAVDTSRC